MIFVQQPVAKFFICFDAGVACGFAEQAGDIRSTQAGSFVARCKVVKDLDPNSVIAQHGWWAEGPQNSPHDKQHPMAASMNSAIDTTLADPISGSIPLRCTVCDVSKLAQR
jgi:hypothetical protein